MLTGRLIRFVRRQSRAAAVWAAIPLVFFNGRTFVGCGCLGHFEAVCHCGCCDGQLGKSACSCCTGHGFNHRSCSCCNQSKSMNRCNTVNDGSHPASRETLQEHHCKSFVLHVVTPVTLTANFDASDLHESLFALAVLGRPSVFTQVQVGQVVDFETGPPPNDLVVTLHRLII
jgi:hypothetical protein